ncbi:hypothetical protein ES703_00028 [subsurface metagenome]
MSIGRAFGFVISSIVVCGVIYYVFEKAGKLEPLKELPEPIVRIRRPM